jgi:hypothetical protein
VEIRGIKGVCTVSRANSLEASASPSNSSLPALQCSVLSTGDGAQMAGSGGTVAHHLIDGAFIPGERPPIPWLFTQGPHIPRRSPDADRDHMQIEDVARIFGAQAAAHGRDGVRAGGAPMISWTLSTRWLPKSVM